MGRSPDRDRGRDRSPRRDHRDRDRDRSSRRDRSPRRDARDEHRRRHSRSRSPNDRRDRGGRRSRSRSRDRERERRGVRFGDERERDRGRERERERERDHQRSEGPQQRSSRAGDERRAEEVHGRPGPPGLPPPPPPVDEVEEGEAVKPPQKKAEPLSLEELLKKKKEEAEALAKPVFLTKKQREELALKKRQEEADAQRAKIDAIRNANAQAAADMRRGIGAPGGGPSRGYDPRDRRGGVSTEELERNKQLENIKQQYMGAEKKKKKVVKASDKFKFNFDWENTEDTSTDINPLYNSLHEAPLLFGRGMRAGADRREQKKEAAKHERDLLTKMRGNKEMTKEELDRQKAVADRADKYDKNDMRIDSHWTSKKLTEMTERDWRIFREDFNIAYRGSNPPLPYRSWDECPLPKQLRKSVDKAGYKKPSPIQMAAIPVGLQQRDVIGLAETGSGKTAAFVLPMLIYILQQPPMTEEIEAEGPYSLIMAPTRELVLQIEEETIKLAEFTGFRVTHVVGGQSIEEQGFKLRRGCEIVVATPGRMLDCLERHYAVLNQCNYVVLDEADRMIDLGFEPQVMGVMDAMPSSNLKPEMEEGVLEANRVYRTTYMFSATMPPAVERIARKYLRRPVVVQIGSTSRATENVTQHIKMLTGKNSDPEKLRLLEDALRAADDKRAIVFVNTRAHCDQVTRKLEENGHHCCVLHGGKAQDAREVSLEGFRQGKFNVLVATDVAGRGIDVQDVMLVVNYDMPNNIEAYTHRIGRTGRAGKKGTAVSFLADSDRDVMFDLKNLLTASKQAVPPELARHEAARQDPKAGGGKKKDDVLYLKGM